MNWMKRQKGWILPLLLAMFLTGHAALGLTQAPVVHADVSAVEVVPAQEPVIHSTYAGKKAGIVGHSFTSANGADNGSVWYRDTESYEEGTTGPDNLCMRSIHAAPVHTVTQLGMSSVNPSCAGAEPKNLYEIPQYNEGVQTQWLTPDMSVVHMGGRGNPEFGKAIEQAIDLSQDPAWQCIPQMLFLGVPIDQCGAHVFDWAVQSYKNRASEEQAIYDSIRARAPNAQIFVHGIPPVTPKFGDDISVCWWFLTGFEVSPLQKLVDALNGMIKAKADENHAIFVDYGQPDSPFLQGRHDVCAPSDAWVHGPRLIQPVNENSLFDIGMWMTGSFHPTIAANNAMAQVLLRTMLANAPPA